MWQMLWLGSFLSTRPTTQANLLYWMAASPRNVHSCGLKEARHPLDRAWEIATQKRRRRSVLEELEFGGVGEAYRKSGSQ
jgi:hypothetical protein